MSELATKIEARWAALQRRGPYAILALATALSIVSAPVIGSRADVPVIAAGAGVLAAAHWWCADRRWGRHRLDDATGQLYLLGRTGLTFALSWLNPFFAVYAFIAYFDAYLYVRQRVVGLVLLVTAVTLAGSQSGGLPPATAMQAGAFAGLLLLNSALAFGLNAIGRQEGQLAEERVETIETLRRTNTALEEALRENAALHSELVARARADGVRDERQRLAAEIHDTVAQGLAGIVTQLQAADATTDLTDAAARRQRAADLARASLVEARRAVQALGPTALDQLPLPEVLEKEVADWSATAGVPVRLVVTGAATSLDPAHEATIVRVVSESLANVAHHARATQVGVTLSFTDHEVMLDVADDGRGFDATQPCPPSAAGGYGLATMRRRAQQVGGRLVLESRPGHGTAVSLSIPVAVRG